MLGFGSHGLVRKVEMDGELRALKTFKTLSGSLPEIDVLFRIRNEGLIKGYSFTRNSVVEDLITGHMYHDQPFFEWIKQFNFQTGEAINCLEKMIITLISAYHCLALNGYLHRDIKPDNIFYSFKDKILDFYLGDYSLMEIMDKNLLTFTSQESSKQGPLLYLPPETKNVFYNSGIWSLGITLLEIIYKNRVSLEMPDYFSLNRQLLASMKLNEYQHLQLKNLLDLLVNMIEEDPRKRLFFNASPEEFFELSECEKVSEEYPFYYVAETQLAELYQTFSEHDEIQDLKIKCLAWTFYLRHFLLQGIAPEPEDCYDLARVFYGESRPIDFELIKVFSGILFTNEMYLNNTEDEVLDLFELIKTDGKLYLEKFLQNFLIRDLK